MINVCRLPLIRLVFLLEWIGVSMFCQQSMFSWDCEISHCHMQQLSQNHFRICQTFINAIAAGHILYRNYIDNFTDWIVPDVLLKVPVYSIAYLPFVPFLYVNPRQLAICVQLWTLNIFFHETLNFYYFFQLFYLLLLLTSLKRVYFGVLENQVIKESLY